VPSLTLLLLLAVTVGAWGGSERSEREREPLAARSSAPIAFIRGDFPRRDLVVVSPTGANARVVDGPILDVRDFSWSPNGRRIVFSAAPGTGSMNLYVVNADGSGRRRITRMIGNEIVPVWSPRGNKIAFERENDGDRSIWVMNADGTRPRQLTTGFDRGFEYPAWSPDGRRITFGQLGTGWIYVMSADGRNPHRVARSRDSHAPRWSPTGKVAYFANRQIWLVNPDGSGRRRVLRAGTKSNESDFRWSPDGRAIAFAGLGAAEGDNEILLASAAGGRTKRRLTNNGMQDTYPSWSPDGTMLAFLRYRDGDNPEAYDVYLINADGSGERNLTMSAADESLPAWSPARR
jgi:Tol biopolymer transport system component